MVKVLNTLACESRSIFYVNTITMDTINIDNILNDMTYEEIQQILDEWEADMYLSSLEANEI